MSNMTKKEMRTLLDETDSGIENAIKAPEVMTKLGEFGITEETLMAIRGLRSDGLSLLAQATPRRSVKIAMTARIRNRINGMFNRMMLYVEMMNRDLSDDIPLLKEFDIEGPWSRTKLGKLEHCESFYQNCKDNPNMAAYVLKYGLTPEAVDARLTEIRQIESDSQYRSLLNRDSQKLSMTATGFLPN